MPDLTSGTQLASNTSGFGIADLEAGKFIVSSGGLVSVRSGGTVTATGSHTNHLGTILVAIGKSAGTLTSTISGLVRYVTQTTPNLDGTGTATTRLVDSAGGTIIQFAAQDESVVTAYGTTVPINTNMTWISDTSGTGQAAIGTIKLNIHYDL
jgi:hypothetical protein